MVTLTRLAGEALDEHLNELARLRIRVFREYPYLYDGDLDYERRYLDTYRRSSGSVIVLATDDERIVGASTAVPMAHETDETQAPFVAAGYDVDDIFYLGESVLLPDYRGRGIGVAFFEQREAHARETGDYSLYCFCAVQRPGDHPARPPGYRALDDFWRKRGYEKRPELTTSYRWKEPGEAHESRKPMTFWTKTPG